ncbi:helix-turn-helix domain-containing protein [Streptosporangium sp. NBC_01469]|uniref:helix-turn-helix domain-containing protein n=1 Tax=Streptosporangium sp. NBC_01469 TaxID=2903898 RepID=UPI002E291148|nr:helix-turn-helix transcriptional regulator [Streptosporangium sp. NBC_01469]
MGNDLDPRLTPTQRFGRELGRARKEAGLSQARLGNHLGVSSSFVGHIETGNRRPSTKLAADCDRFFETDDLFTHLCRNIAAPSGPSWFLRWSDEIEPRARVLRSWDPLLVPGLLQTEKYARAVFRGDLATSDQEVEEQVGARMRRQLILKKDSPPMLWALLDEWVLRRPIGGPEVMYEQLDHLAAVAGRQNVTVQIVPHDTSCTTGLMSGFVLAQLTDAPTAVSVESAGAGEVSAEHNLVGVVWDRYDKIRAEAHRPGQSLKMIEEARDQWKQ